MAKPKKILVDPGGQLKFFKMPNPLNLKLWDIYGGYLSGHARDLDKQEEALAEKCGWLMWDVGDWLIEGQEGGLPMKKLRTYAEKHFPRRAWKTLRNWKVTALAIESSRRRDGREGRRSLEYSLHKEVEKFDPDLQDELLAIAEERPYTVNEFRAYVKKWHKFNGMLLPNKENGTTVEVLQDQLKWSTHRQPRRYVNDAILVEDVRNQGDPEQRDRGQRQLQRDPPQVNVTLGTELGRAWGEHAM